MMNYDEIRRLLDLEDWQPHDDGIGEVRSLYLGTVFALVPSGKYYTAWACSNVTDEEAEGDAQWYEKVQEEFEKRGMFLESGEGDPCDLFACECRDEE